MIFFDFKFISRRLSAQFGAPQRTPKTFFFTTRDSEVFLFTTRDIQVFLFTTKDTEVFLFTIRDRPRHEVGRHKGQAIRGRQAWDQRGISVGSATSDTWETSVGSAWDQRQAIRWRRQTSRMHPITIQLLNVDQVLKQSLADCDTKTKESGVSFRSRHWTWVADPVLQIAKWQILCCRLLSARSCVGDCWVADPVLRIAECQILCCRLLSGRSCVADCWVPNPVLQIAEWQVLCWRLLSARSCVADCWVTDPVLQIAECQILCCRMLSGRSFVSDRWDADRWFDNPQPVQPIS